MADYKAMYTKTFNAITDAERQLQQVTEMLRMVQQECEEMYLANDTQPIDLAGCITE